MKRPLEFGQDARIYFGKCLGGHVAPVRGDQPERGAGHHTQGFCFGLYLISLIVRDVVADHPPCDAVIKLRVDKAGVIHHRRECTSA